MSNHLISVIVPVYNVEPYLRQCLDSIVGQTYTNIEILIVDDGSPDHCGEICDEYAQKDFRITVIHQENAGLSAARNAALDIARGEYIMFVDSDDWVEPIFCEKALSLITTQKVSIVIFGYLKHNQQKTEIRKAFSSRIINASDTLKHFILMDEPSIHTIAWNKIYHNSLFQEYRFPQGMLYEDIDAGYHLIDAAKEIYVSDVSLYNYRLHTNGISSFVNNNKPNHIKDRFHLMYSRLCFIRNNYPELDEIGTNDLASYAMSHILRLHHSRDKKEQEIVKTLSDFLYDNKKFLLSKPCSRPLRFFLYSKSLFNIYVFLSKVKRTFV